MTTEKRPRFSDAARLYAQNEPVVRAMEKAFRSSVAEVLEAARQETNRIVCEELAEEGRCVRGFLVGKSPDKKWPWMRWHYAPLDAPATSGPSVWFYTTDPEIVARGFLEVTAVAAKSSKADRLAYRKAETVVGLPPRAGEEGGLFTFDVPCAGSDPAAEIAAPIARALVALRRIERKLGPA